MDVLPGVIPGRHRSLSATDCNRATLLPRNASSSRQHRDRSRHSLHYYLLSRVLGLRGKYLGHRGGVGVLQGLFGTAAEVFGPWIVPSTGVETSQPFQHTVERPASCPVASLS